MKLADESPNKVDKLCERKQKESIAGGLYPAIFGARSSSVQRPKGGVSASLLHTDLCFRRPNVLVNKPTGCLGDPSLHPSLTCSRCCGLYLLWTLISSGIPSRNVTVYSSSKAPFITVCGVWDNCALRCRVRVFFFIISKRTVELCVYVRSLRFTGELVTVATPAGTRCFGWSRVYSSLTDPFLVPQHIRLLDRTPESPLKLFLGKPTYRQLDEWWSSSNTPT